MGGRGGALLRRALGWPLRRALDPRVRGALAEVDERLGSAAGARPALHDRLDDLDRRGRETLAALGWRDAPGAGRTLDALDAPTAAFLNWATGPEGYAAQAGAWFNAPVPVEHHPGRVGVLLVNERIVEQPFVFAALAALAPGSRVLDVGGAESTVGLSLAALGHRVTVVDPRPHPLAHPGLVHAACRLDELRDDDVRYDAAVALSAVEHFGLDGYAGAGGTPDVRADLAATARLRELVRPGGLLVLTVPFGASSADEHQRVYDEAGLAELLAGWEPVDSRRAGRVDGTTWALGAPSAPGEHGVALVCARRG
jgi:hypothetical protein